MFELKLHPDRRLVVMRLWGFWDDATITDFERALAQLLERLPRNKSLDWLVDSRDFPVQSQSIVSRLAKARSSSVDYERQLAMVIPGMLSRLQVSRESPTERFFKTLDEATAWLAAPS